uniref:G-protein coupled receptors family 1 profile domain-containing protein n=1 Tax=Plectus sambesii TaxID=2011161 RepID=A0A914VCV3_9BILA
MNDSVSMSNQSAVKMSEQERSDLLVRFTIYIFESSLLIFLNFAMFTAIVRLPALRAQYTILCGLLFTDGLMGFATISAGIGRNVILLSNTQDNLVSRRTCMFKPWNLLFIWTDPMTSIMLMVISIDRLLAVCLPIQYYKRSAKLGRWQLIAAHTFMLCSVITGWSLAYPENKPLYPSICWSSKGIHSGYFVYHTWLRIIAALMSVILYGIVVALMWMRARRIAASTRWGVNLGVSRFSKRQVKLNVSMGISCLCTCVFYVLPICIELYEVVSGAESDWLGSVMSFSQIISNLNSICNFIVLMYRHADIRRAVLSLLTCGKISAIVPSSTVANFAHTVRNVKSVC